MLSPINGTATDIERVPSVLDADDPYPVWCATAASLLGDPRSGSAADAEADPEPDPKPESTESRCRASSKSFSFWSSAAFRLAVFLFLKW